MQHKQAQKVGESALKGKNCGLFFCIVGFCSLVVFVSLWGIVLYRGAEVAFCACCEHVRMACIA